MKKLGLVILILNFLIFPIAQPVYAAPVRGEAGDLWADVVLGHIDFNQATPNETVPFKVFNPGGTLVDRTVTPNRIYVYDGANSRILGYKSLGTCENNSATLCTSHSDCALSKCNFQQNKPADLVLGQPKAQGFSGCNHDGNMSNYPLRKRATEKTLCSTPESQNSPGEGGSFASMAIDTNGNLFVPDFFNSRVLMYNSPFTTDTAADEVWGQADFAGNKCNRTDGDLAENSIPNPVDTSLCMGRNTKYQESFVAGVDIDSHNNLWVADSSNHRVLRFPNSGGTIAKTADLVLGQPDFTTRESGNGANQMKEPAVVRVDKNDWVYVADKGNNRILIFKPPFTNGMNYSALFGSQLAGPASIEFDLQGKGIWVSDDDNHMVELWNSAGTEVKKVLFKDTYQPNGRCGTVTENITCRNQQPDGSCWDNMCVVRGSIGIDIDNNLFITSAIFNQDAWRFAAPIPNPQEGLTYSADYRLFAPPEGQNYSSNKGLNSPRGVVIRNNQLIVSDGNKLVFWNDYKNVKSGDGADGFAGVASFQDKDPWELGRIAADDQDHLWVIRNSTVDVYQLPLTTGATPIKTAITFQTPIPVLGGGQISWGFEDLFWGIDIDHTGKYLWLTHASDAIHRVMRIRDPFTNPVIDVILGQPNATESSCNRNSALNNSHGTAGPTDAAANTLCKPGAVKLDRKGNVWVSDHSLEDNGNKRILEFNAAQFKNITTTALFGPDANLVSPYVQSWSPAFDSQNRMVIGYNGQSHPPGFPGLYKSPLTTLRSTATPDMTLKDYFSHGYSAAFDEEDNLLIADLNRGRVLIYNKPFQTVAFTLADLKTAINNYGNSDDSIFTPVDAKINSLDFTHIIHFIQ